MAIPMTQNGVELRALDSIAGLRYDPDNAYLHAALGGVHVVEGEPLAAVAAYDRALAADPSLVAAWAGRAEALLQAGDDGAIASLNQALEVAEDAALLFNRAAVFGSAGRWADAVADLTRAARAGPRRPGHRRAAEGVRGASKRPPYWRGKTTPACRGYDGWSRNGAGR
jgi:tetratricopeptide (TPR) repeat protein